MKIWDEMQALFPGTGQPEAIKKAIARGRALQADNEHLRKQLEIAREAIKYVLVRVPMYDPILDRVREALTATAALGPEDEK